MMLLGETATLGAFVAQDLLLFVLFFDLMLVPFYFLFGAWGSDREGGPTASAATLKMIVYTLIGSLLMLVGAIATAIIAADGGQITFSIAELAKHPIGEGSQHWIFWFFAAAFLVKMPAFLLHGWMPDAYRAAPLPVLAVFSGVLAKVGAYGFLRVVLPLFPDATVQFQEVVLVIALASILYGSVMAFTQTNVRLIGGYSSVAQLGFITAGIFALRADGADGAVLQMVNHGLVVAPLFIIVAILAERSGTRGPARDGRHGDARPGAGGALPDRHPGDPGDAGLGQLHRRVLHPQRPLPGEDRLRLRRHLRRRDVGLLRAAPLPADDAQPQAGAGSRSREIGLRDGLVLAPLVLCIVGLALYPQLILKRTDTLGAASRSRRRPRGQRRRHSWRPRARMTTVFGSQGKDRRSVAANDLQRPPHRLRGALAGHRPDRRRSASSCSRAVIKPLRRTRARADPDRPGDDRRPADLALERPDRTSSPARCASTTWRSRSR